jgi:hypothetical protein
MVNPLFTRLMGLLSSILSTQSKITKIISNLKNTKTLGVDNIATEVWKKGKITLF